MRRLVMDDFERKAFRASRLRAHQRRLKATHASCQECGVSDLGCLVCGEDDPDLLEADHIAGRKHDDTTFHLCRNHHALRSDLQREEPKGGSDPKNPLEIIGRWLLGIAQYFELLIDTLRLFGEFLIELARKGYG